MLKLITIGKFDKDLKKNMEIHYSHPKGFVGRSICYAVVYNEILYGHIIGGSATKFLPGRNDYFNIDGKKLNQIVNNIFYHIEKVGDKYPKRNFTSYVLKNFRQQIIIDWYNKYGDIVIGFESLVELPRSGECYKRDGWELVGQTIGYTCKRVGGQGTDSWSGKRVWNTTELRPKLVFVKKV